MERMVVGDRAAHESHQPSGLVVVEEREWILGGGGVKTVEARCTNELLPLLLS